MSRREAIQLATDILRWAADHPEPAPNDPLPPEPSMWGREARYTGRVMFWEPGPHIEQGCVICGCWLECGEPMLDTRVDTDTNVCPDCVAGIRATPWPPKVGG